MITSGVL